MKAINSIIKNDQRYDFNQVIEIINSFQKFSFQIKDNYDEIVKNILEIVYSKLE